MMRFFNTEGPVNPKKHYYLPPLSRIDIHDILHLIANEKYFLLHAPRQTGKTTCLLALMDYLNQEGTYRALYVNIEGAQAARENVEQGITAVIHAIAGQAKWYLKEEQTELLSRKIVSEKSGLVALEAFLTAWCDVSNKATVLLLDEVDALIGDTLISLLRQLRAGYPNRPKLFPQTIILCGVRDIQDYRIHSSSEKAVITGGSAFNIKAESLRLGEPRVRRVIEPMLAGGMITEGTDDDRQYLVDLGLLRRDGSGGLVIANPIYREVIPRILAGAPQDSLPHISPTWLKPDGSLDIDRLLYAFLEFWRQHGEPLLGSVPYHEIAPHLVLMAFLHRVVNAGGTIDREYAIGWGRMDLCVRYGGAVLGIELKVWRDEEPDPLKKGLEQIDVYLSGLGLNFGWLVIFDRRSGQPKIFERTQTEAAQTVSGKTITVIRA